jgi:hypothetical protein
MENWVRWYHAVAEQGYLPDASDAAWNAESAPAKHLASFRMADPINLHRDDEVTITSHNPLQVLLEVVTDSEVIQAKGELLTGGSDGKDED